MLFKSVVWGVLASALGLFSQISFAVTYQYDDLGRLIEVIYDSGRKVTYAYDPAGNRTEHEVVITSELPINDTVPTQGIGSNLIDLSGWPIGDAPTGAPTVTGWANSSTFYNEARWARVTGPGQSSSVTTMEAGQTETDANGGGTSHTNYFTIDKTKAYEFSLYFRKHNLTVQSLYFGLSQGGLVKYIANNTINTNPYFLSWSVGTQAAYLDSNKWYKVVGYVLPEGYPQESTSGWGGVYDVETGTRIANVTNFRWNEDHTATQADARFFTYYTESVQNSFTNYFYQPEIRITNVSYVPVVPSMSASHSDATEGSNITYTVNLSVATTVDVKVDYVVTDNGATSSDYTATSGTLIIATGQTQGIINVATNSDSILEANEGIKLTLSSPVRATISSGESTETAYIIDDGLGNGASFSVNDVSVTEGGNLSFVVTKSGSTALSHSVSYATANGSGASGSDYTAKSGTLIFTSGQTTKTVNVVTSGDSAYENNETVYFNLSSATSGAIIADAQGVGTINNNDTAPAFSINNVSVTEGGTLTFTVIKTGSTAFSHNVNYATANGTAIAGSDYTSKSGTLSFTSGQTSKTISVATTQEAVFESDETLYVNLSGATNSATISDSQGVGTINNDDSSFIIAVNSSGVVQSPYIVDTTYLTYPIVMTIMVLKDGAGFGIYFTTSGNLCVGGTFIVENSVDYSFSGNGCEIIYQP